MSDNPLRIELRDITARAAVFDGRGELTISQATLLIHFLDDVEVSVPELSGHAWYMVQQPPVVTIGEIRPESVRLYPKERPAPKTVPAPAHLHDATVMPLLRGAKTIYSGAQYERWFCKGCDAVTLLPADKENDSA